MDEKKIIILGAGPSGLSVAHGLLDAGFAPADILVLEQESVPGGLCRSEMVDGAPLDIGGGHFLDLKHEHVLNFLFRFLPRQEWNRFERRSRILLHGREIDHPLEANIRQLPLDIQVDYLDSIARAGSVRGEPMPESFSQWILWKFGRCIARDYMLPYNRKIWSMELDRLGTYWLYKLPDVSFRDTLRSCLEGKPAGTLPAHGTFLYPKDFGYGELWLRMGKALGDALITDCPVRRIDPATRTVNERWRGELIISTIPWTHWPACCDLPGEIASAIDRLKHVAVDVAYQPDSFNSDAHWLYEPNESVAQHRYLVRSNFIPGARGYWTETNSSRSSGKQPFRFHNEFAYPVNTIDKPRDVETVRSWAADRGIIGLGRWGKWEHMNSDVAVAEALELAEKIAMENL